MKQTSNFNHFIKKQARKEGFVLCGISKCEEVSNTNHLNDWLSQGRNAGMDWFLRNGDKRENPTLLVDGAKTIISFAYPYAPISEHNIAAYANAIDYHFTLKEKLTNIIAAINEHFKIEITARAFTDSAPIMERYWAQKSGLGWIGKSGMLINRRIGSYLLLCEIICDVESDIYDTEDPFDGCGKCRRCIKACPTKAICNNKTIDARKCISYITIEHRGEFTPEQVEIVKNNDWLYGCDECLKCCPWNKQQAVSATLFINDDIMEMSSADFKKKYRNTPLERSGLKQIRRNYVGKIF